jgi:hypothetical protein
VEKVSIMLQTFREPVGNREGDIFWAKACGRERADRLWEGWIEFEGADGGILRSARETTQPNLTDLKYWASGLTQVYLEGSLARTLEPTLAAAPERKAERKDAHDRSAA